MYYCYWKVERKLYKHTYLRLKQMSAVSSRKVTKQAFGHQARLGSLYDICQDKFEGGNLFKKHFRIQ